jgi:hypothetical protein
MIDQCFGWSRRPAMAPPQPEPEPELVPVSEIRRGDRFAEVLPGAARTYLALEDARRCQSSSHVAGHGFTALGNRGPEYFFCADDGIAEGPSLYRLALGWAGEDQLLERLNGRQRSLPMAVAAPSLSARCPCEATPADANSPAILIIAQNSVWLAGLKSVCRELGSVTGWTAREWPSRIAARGPAPQLVIHHRGDAPAADADVHARIGRRVRRRWPGVKWVTITDDSGAVGGEAGVCLPQDCSGACLRGTVEALLNGWHGQAD